jgi:hypothetical protein
MRLLCKTSIRVTNSQNDTSSKKAPQLSIEIVFIARQKKGASVTLRLLEVLSSIRIIGRKQIRRGG